MTNLRKGQVRLGPRTWAVIREAYLSGASAASLAETYGCSLGTIRYRAVREGWRRCDVHGEGAGPPATPGPDRYAEPATPRALQDLAIDAAGRALRAGRPSDAAAYVRVAEALLRLGGAPSEMLEVIPPAELEARRGEFAERFERIQAAFALKRREAEGLTDGPNTPMAPPATVK